MRAAVPKCAKAILRDWLPDDRIDGTYPTRCYEAVLRLVPQNGYGDGSLVSALDEKLRY